MALGLGVRDGLRRAGDLRQRRGEGEGLPGDLGAPSRSASYSREREIAIWITAAASGARSAVAIMTSGFGRSPSRPPKKKPNWARVEIAPAKVALMVMISVSRFLMWAISCAMTPAISSGLRIRSRPVVAATAAFCGLRPVAKAFGCGLSMR